MRTGVAMTLDAAEVPDADVAADALVLNTRPHFYQTRSAWSVDQGSNKNHSPAYNFAPTVTKFCVMWEGLSLPHDTKFGNCRCKIVDSRAFPSWSLIHGLRWSGLIKAEPGYLQLQILQKTNKFCKTIYWKTCDICGNGNDGLNCQLRTSTTSTLFKLDLGKTKSVMISFIKFSCSKHF